MAMYSVHIRETDGTSGRAPNVVFVPDRFSVTAMVFGFLWALWIGAWDVALVLFAVQMAAGALIPVFVPGEAAQAVAQAGLAVAIGFVAFELRRMLLALRGYGERGVVSGSDDEEAERRYFDTHPDLTARMLGLAV